jgi:hypothetical protein
MSSVGLADMKGWDRLTLSMAFTIVAASFPLSFKVIYPFSLLSTSDAICRWSMELGFREVKSRHCWRITCGSTRWVTDYGQLSWGVGDYLGLSRRRVPGAQVLVQLLVSLSTPSPSIPSPTSKSRFQTRSSQRCPVWSVVPQPIRGAEFDTLTIFGHRTGQTR